MNKPKRECGSCKFWIKIKRKSTIKGQSNCGGLCNLLDLFCSAQYGKSCSYWKGKKYK